MASEYLKKKYRGVKPDAHRALTPAEKRKNWWHYHKWHVGIAAVLLLIGVDWGYHAATQIHPDYQIAYVGAAPLPGEAAAAWESRLVALGADCSGDGRVTVRLHSYLSPGEDAMAGYAASVKLLADLEACDSYFFLLEDPEQFQREYHTLRRLDGTLPEEEEDSAEGTYLVWADCPVLAALELGEYSYGLMDSAMTGSNQELLSPLCLARRGFWTEKASAYTEGCDELWNKLTEGATP